MDQQTSDPQRLERHVLVVTGLVALGAIMTVLDTTIVSVAVHAMSGAFAAPLSTIQWVATGYMLALAAVIPLTGWAAGRFGGKTMWMFSLSLFLLGSLLCGFAWSAGSLIAFRVLQGLGGGMVLPTGQTLLAQAAGRERIGRVMSLVGIPLLLGPIFGPVLGGFLIDRFSWEWIFFINLPIGFVALPLSWRLLDSTPARRSERVDVRGLVLLSPGLALLVYGLSSMIASGSSAFTGALPGIIGGVVLLGLFAVHALRAASPLLDLKLFTDRTFTAANLVNLLAGASMIGATFLLPLYYQTLRDQSALMAGLLIAPQGVGAALSMPLGGRLVDRGRAGVAVFSGAIVMAIGFVAFVRPSPDVSFVTLSVALFVIGLGVGCTITPAFSSAYRDLPYAAMPRATAMLNIVQRVGGLLGTALFAVILQAQVRSRVPATLGGAHVLGTIPPGTRHQVVPALAGAFGTAFWWPLACAALVVIPALMLPIRNGNQPRQPAAPQHSRQEMASPPGRPDSQVR